MRKVGVAIIGQGRSGRNIHGNHLRNDPRYRILAVADPLADRRQRAVREYGCEAYADYHDLLGRRDIDLVVNATFSHLHPSVTVDILKAGHHVLCEKPLAAKVRDVDRMIAAAKKARRTLAVFQQSRYAGYFQQVRKVIKSGVLGRIIQISIAFNGFARRWDWQTLRDYNGGNLLNTGPHPLDQALQLFGPGMPKVTCFMDRANTAGDAEDHVKLILSGPNRPTIDLEISSCCAYPCFTYNLYGTRGGLKGSASAMEWRYFKPGEARRLKLVATPLSKPDGTPAYCSGARPDNLKWHVDAWPVSVHGRGLPGAGGYAAAEPNPDMTAEFYKMLYKALTGKAALTITPAEVRRQIAVIEACRRQNPHIYGKK